MGRDDNDMKKNRNKYNGALGSFFGLMMLLLPVLASAAEIAPAAELEKPLGSRRETGPLKLGPVEVHPYVSIKETYSDNIFSTSTNKEHDFIMVLNPGIYLQLPVRNHTLSLAANTSLTRYAKFSSENTDDYFVNGTANFMFGSQINLKASDTFIKGHEPRGSSSSGTIEKFDSNTAAASLTYLLADVSKIQLDYSRTDWDFKTSTFRSRSEDLISAYLYYRLMPKTSAFIQYNYKSVRFDDRTVGLDNKMQAALIGLSWDITGKSRGSLAGGFLRKNFNDSSKDDLKTWTASADITHNFSDYTSLKLIGKREVNEASLLGTRYYITTGLYGEVTHKFLQRLALVAKASYGQDKYSDIIPGDTQLRKDNTLTAGMGLRYIMRRWLEFVLEYNYRNKDSNIDIYSAKENTVTLMMNASF
ncbi:MAG: hypothetical protein C0402_13340 [Thermodesulfovibrio sp.]|nr:hypothetical protein [Thermodesulfovibrio sp.]